MKIDVVAVCHPFAAFPVVLYSHLNTCCCCCCVVNRETALCTATGAPCCPVDDGECGVVDAEQHRHVGVVDPAQHKVRIYKEYHSVCPLVGIGTIPTQLSPASVPLPPEPGGGHTHLRASEGLGESQFRRLEKRLSTLPTLWRQWFFLPSLSLYNLSKAGKCSPIFASRGRCGPNHTTAKSLLLSALCEGGRGKFSFPE